MASTAFAIECSVRRTAAATRASSRFKIFKIPTVDFSSRPYELGFRRSVVMAFNQCSAANYSGSQMLQDGDTLESGMNCAEEVMGPSECLFSTLAARHTRWPVWEGARSSRRIFV